jgi:hypothetical protein
VNIIFILNTKHLIYLIFESLCFPPPFSREGEGGEFVTKQEILFLSKRYSLWMKERNTLKINIYICTPFLKQSLVLIKSDNSIVNIVVLQEGFRFPPPFSREGAGGEFVLLFTLIKQNYLDIKYNPTLFPLHSAGKPPQRRGK